MALDSSVYGSVATPRIFVDIVQFCRAKGIPIGHYHWGYGFSGTYEDVWDMNPAKANIAENAPTTHFENITHEDYNLYYTRWGIMIDTDGTRPEIQKLLATCNYYAMLGHNFADISENDTTIAPLSGGDEGVNYGYEQYYTEDVYAPDRSMYDRNGYRIKTISPNLESSIGVHGNRGFIVLLKSSTQSDNIKLGAISVGRYFDFPHSANLSMNIDHSFDGIKKRRTIGGSDLVNVSYNSPPNWIGEYRPFTNTTESATLGYGGRRSWDLTFSYLDKEAVFPKNFNEQFMFDKYISESDESMDLFSNPTQENILSHYFTLTQGGSIPHILQPDKTKEDFCLVRLDRSSLRINQTAPLLYDVKMRFVETW